MIIKSQLKMSTAAALNNTRDQHRDTQITLPAQRVYFSRSLEMVGARQEKRAMTQAQRRGRSEFTSEPFHVIRMVRQ